MNILNKEQADKLRELHSVVSNDPDTASALQSAISAYENHIAFGMPTISIYAIVGRELNDQYVKESTDSNHWKKSFDMEHDAFVKFQDATLKELESLRK